MIRPVSAAATGVILAAVLTAPAAAQNGTAARDRLLVSTAWLAEHLNDPKLVLLHVGERSEYDASHIPGAIYVTMGDVDRNRGQHAAEGMRHLELPEPAALRAKLESWGISDDSRVVVYYGNDWVSPSTRILFTLDWIGLGDRSALLDGGMQAWRAEGRPLTADVPAPRAGRLSAKPVRDVVVDRAFVQGLAGRSGFALVDARAAVFYDGVQAGTGDRKGRIPGARSLPFGEVADERMYVRPAAELAELFRKAGVDAGETVILYCHVGQQATAVLFAARTLGIDARLYDGSFEDWALSGQPIELPGASGRTETRR